MTQEVQFPSVFADLVSDQGLSPQRLGEVFDAILGGAWTNSQIAGLLVGLRLRGETPEHIAAAAAAMRRVMIAVPHELPLVIDTCGTGGDGQRSLNLSTGAAIIVAACGVAVAKHGNRAASSQAGSADVLEALGIPLRLSPDASAELLREVGITFMMAPVHHPAMRHAAPTRKELGVRTLFNVLGPLANPARPTHQLLGVWDDAYRPALARTLGSLGCKRAWVVRGEDGLDELTPHGLTRVTELDGGALRELTVTPESFGLTRLEAGAITGSDPQSNADVLEGVLKGEPHPSRDAFLLNAAASLVVALRIEPREATARARAAIESGAAHALLARWRAAARLRSTPES